jgi:hypothetical protein
VNSEYSNIVIPINLDVTIHMLHVRNIPVRAAIQSQHLDGASLEETFEFMKLCAADEESRNAIENLTFSEFRYLSEEWMKINMFLGEDYE